MYYLLLYDVVEDFVARRSPFREEHLKLANEARSREELVMAGAFSEPADGAALLFRSENRDTVARFAEADPYVRGGLVKSWRVRGWSVVVGG